MFKTLTSRTHGKTRTVVAADLSALVGAQLRSYILHADRTPQEVAESLDVPVAEVRRVLQGRGCSVDLLSNLLAVSGLTLEQLLSQEPEYREVTAKVVDPANVYLSMLRGICTVQELRVIAQSVRAFSRNPRLRKLGTVMFSQFLNSAERAGFDPEEADSLVSRAVASATSSDE